MAAFLKNTGCGKTPMIASITLCVKSLVTATLLAKYPFNDKQNNASDSDSDKSKENNDITDNDKND